MDARESLGRFDSIGWNSAFIIEMIMIIIQMFSDELHELCDNSRNGLEWMDGGISRPSCVFADSRFCHMSPTNNKH